MRETAGERTRTPHPNPGRGRATRRRLRDEKALRRRVLDTLFDDASSTLEMFTRERRSTTRKRAARACSRLAMSRYAVIARSTASACARTSAHCSFESEIPFFPGSHVPSFW